MNNEVFAHSTIYNDFFTYNMKKIFVDRTKGLHFLANHVIGLFLHFAFVYLTFRQGI